jgi:hypothetical protein
VVDQRALSILFDTYWTAAGWREAPVTRPEDFEYAKAAGVMFDGVSMSHDDAMARVASSIRGVKRRAVANAFVESLASRRLDRRSALGSFAVLQHLPAHAGPLGRANCPVCGVYGEPFEREDLNVLNFERFKWGGVRHDDPIYASFDLLQFQQLSGEGPDENAIEVFRRLLATIEAAPPMTSSTKLEKQLARSFKSNKAERTVVIGILGLCGILAPAAHPGFIHKFIPWCARELPPRRFVDMAYPACWWKRSDGVNREAVAYWFGHLL